MEIESEIIPTTTPQPNLGRLGQVAKNPRKTEPELSVVDFECPKCKQPVKGNRGYYAEHTITRTNRYGLGEERLCSASNNKIKAELRSLDLHGECGSCGLEMDFKVTEEYPGGLKQEGGVMEVPCIACNGRTEATCEKCGNLIAKDDKGVWQHDLNGENECPGQVLADDGDEDLDEDLDDEFFEPAPKEPTVATPMAGTEKTNELHLVLVHDNFVIEEREDSTAESTNEDALVQDPQEV